MFEVRSARCRLLIAPAAHVTAQRTEMPDNEPGPEVCFYFADLTAGPGGRIALVRISPLSRSATAWRRHS